MPLFVIVAELAAIYISTCITSLVRFKSRRIQTDMITVV